MDHRSCSPQQPMQEETKKSTSYLLWAGIFFQLNGLHRLYNGKIGTGLLWLFTFGLFGIGQMIDLFIIPDMVDEHNWKLRKRLGMAPNGIPLGAKVTNGKVYEPPVKTWEPESGKQQLSQDELMIKLAQIAQQHQGKLSVTQAVIETGVSFSEIEATLKAMLKKGYVAVDNHPETGVVVYDFTEIS